MPKYRHQVGCQSWTLDPCSCGSCGAGASISNDILWLSHSLPNTHLTDHGFNTKVYGLCHSYNCALTYSTAASVNNLASDLKPAGDASVKVKVCLINVTCFLHTEAYKLVAMLCMQR